MPERPSKKQYELLGFIERFITEHGYGPSYREIMNGCNYSSVATVALHVNNLINKGHLRKKDRSARSLEVVPSAKTTLTSNKSISPASGNKEWLVGIIENKFAEASENPQQNKLDELQVLVNALRILNLNEVADNFQNRLDHIRHEP